MQILFLVIKYLKALICQIFLICLERERERAWQLGSAFLLRTSHAPPPSMSASALTITSLSQCSRKAYRRLLFWKISISIPAMAIAYYYSVGNVFCTKFWILNKRGFWAISHFIIVYLQLAHFKRLQMRKCKKFI